jgi:hypothetical protein
MPELRGTGDRARGLVSRKQVMSQNFVWAQLKDGGAIYLNAAHITSVQISREEGMDLARVTTTDCGPDEVWTLTFEKAGPYTSAAFLMNL